MGEALNQLKNVILGRRRLKPSFLIIGAQKAGTSALFSMLEKHPDILTGPIKELHFFDNDESYAKGISHYYEKFPIGKPGQTTFEATPRYLSESKFADRIKKHLPQIKLIAILRDPISRAHSAWNMFHDFKEHPKYSGLYDSRTFDEAIAQELGKEESAMTSDYISRAYYATQLEEYFERFGRENVMVISYSSFRAEPFKVVNGILRFVGLLPFQTADAIKIGSRNKRAYHGTISEETRTLLEQHFMPHNEKLKELLGPAFSF